MTCSQHLVRQLAATTRRSVGKALAGRPVDALVDFPNYPNVGDSAIYLGQLACLESLGVPAPRFICDFTTYDRDALRRALGDGVILLSGGGSFGDTWPTAQACREDILRSFPRHPVVQLPQSIHFSDPKSLARARRIVAEHRAFTLLVRDDDSRDLARQELGVPAHLCPDMAFCLGPITPPRPPTRDLVWLARTDVESRHPPPPSAEGMARDWIEEPATWLRRLNWTLMAATARRPQRRWRRRLQRATFRPLAQQRLTRGIAILTDARVAITDRLHGHVLSLLLGRPHVILDNSYGKISSFHAAWTANAADVQLARGPEEALERARAWLPRWRGGEGP